MVQERNVRCIQPSIVLPRRRALRLAAAAAIVRNAIWYAFFKKIKEILVSH
jgi:hypothetical protein